MFAAGALSLVWSAGRVLAKGDKRPGGPPDRYQVSLLAA